MFETVVLEAVLGGAPEVYNSRVPRCGDRRSAFVHGPEAISSRRQILGLGALLRRTAVSWRF
jgi:hypothetical protein